MTRVEQLIAVQEEARQMFEKKNKDYGDAFAEYGPVGVLVRMGDKIRRAANISKRGVSLVDDERLRDTLIDLTNYSAMAVLLIDEKEEIKINATLQQSVVWKWSLDRSCMRFVAVNDVFNLAIEGSSWEELLQEANDSLQDVLHFLHEEDQLHDFLKIRNLFVDCLLDDASEAVKFTARHEFEEDLNA